MPQTTPVSTDHALSPQPANPPAPSTRDQAREERWQQLIKLHARLSRLMVETTLHGCPDEGDNVARQVVDVEDDLERLDAVRWAHMRQRLLRVESLWWGEQHGEDILSCRACRVLNLAAPAPLSVPARRTWK